MKKLNWKPVITSLLRTMEDNGYILFRVDDAEGLSTEESTSIDRAVDLICSVDESNVFFDTEENHRIRLYIVLGNSPSETVADYSIPKHGAKKLDKVLEDWSDSWEGKDCPTEDFDDPHELLNTIADIAYNAPELNISNYNHDQVRALNEAMIQIYNLVKKYH